MNRYNNDFEGLTRFAGELSNKIRYKVPSIHPGYWTKRKFSFAMRNKVQNEIKEMLDHCTGECILSETESGFGVTAWYIIRPDTCDFPILLIMRYPDAKRSRGMYIFPDKHCMERILGNEKN